MTSNSFYSANTELPEVSGFFRTTTGANVKGLPFLLDIMIIVQLNYMYFLLVYAHPPYCLFVSSW